MELYHGTDKKSSKKMIENKINVHLGGGEIGQGFYTGDLSHQAFNWAYHKYKDEKVVVKIDIKDEDLLSLNPEFLDYNQTRLYRAEIKKNGKTRIFRFNQNIVWAPVVGKNISNFYQLKFESEEAEIFLNTNQVTKTEI